MLKSGIYMIINDANGKVYIGSAVDFSKRFTNHKSDLRKNKHDNSHLQKAWNKYGEKNFRFLILQRVNKEDLLKYEQLWLDWTKSYDDKIGYNILKVAGSNLGLVISNELKLKLSDKLTGRILSNEHRANKFKFEKGHSPSNEVCIKISEALKGKKFTDWHRINQALSRRDYFARKKAANVIGVLSMGC